MSDSPTNTRTITGPVIRYNNVSIYEIRHRYGTMAFLLASVVVVGIFLYFSNAIVKDLAIQERARMQIWADATKEIVNLSSSESDVSESNIVFLLNIIEDNNNIPVLLTDDDGNIIQARNFTLPDPTAITPTDNATNAAFLQERLAEMRHGDNVIDIDIAPGIVQHLYYEDSTLLRRLSLYPYIQLAVMAAFVIVVYLAVTSSKRAEQNKVWVGLSKETAHQLGTPISSLMAWVELLREQGTDPEIVMEMDKDVKRLSTIASRFSKIGSQPSIEPGDVNATVRTATDYMSTRISPRINLSLVECPGPLPVRMCGPLIQWVMENLIKNAVDAMEGSGSIIITTMRDRHMAVIDVTDTGKGMSRKRRKEIFRPGFTTKKRGWGLGLTLAKRIIEQYHGGRIFVSDSEPGIGTTFRIQIPIETA